MSSVSQNPSNEVLTQILKSSKRIAIIGASANEDRPSYGVMKKLLSVGYEVIPVNPGVSEILGRKAYGSLLEVSSPIDIVNVFRQSQYTPEIAREAVKKNAKVLWLQLGIHSDEAQKICQESGVIYISDNCIAVSHTMLRI